MFAVAAAFVAFLGILWLQDGALWDFDIEDPDSALRLVLVRALLDGQSGWFDYQIWRLDPPAGTAIHWSRLVDAPLAGLIAGLGLFFPGQESENLALALWPLGLGLIFIFYVLALGRFWTLAAQSRLPACVAAVGFLSFIQAFHPGYVDHHNIQLLLVLIALTGALSLDHRPVAGGLEAGLAATLSVAVGMEAVPFIFLIGVFFAVNWVIRPCAETRAAARFFGISLGVGAPILGAVLIGPEPYALAACDAFSPLQVIILGLGGLGLAGLTVCPGLIGLRLRIGLGGLGVILSAVILWLAPQCLGGPYADLHPRLAVAWLPLIDEARGLLSGFNSSGSMALGIMTLAIVSGVGVLFLSGPVWQSCAVGRRLQVILIIGLLGLALGLTFIQLRLYIYVMLFALPGLILLVTRARIAYERRGGPGALIGLAGAWIFLFPISVFLFFGLWENGSRPFSLTSLVGKGADFIPDGQSHGPGQAASACRTQDAYGHLAALPPGLVINDLNLAPYILLYTSHDAVGGNYHRGVGGILDSMDFFDADWSRARAVVQRRRAAYVALCRTSGEGDERPGVKRSRENMSVAETLRSGGKHPDWLLPVVGSDEGPLLIYRIIGDSLARPGEEEFRP